MTNETRENRGKSRKKGWDGQKVVTTTTDQASGKELETPYALEHRRLTAAYVQANANDVQTSCNSFNATRTSSISLATPDRVDVFLFASLPNGLLHVPGVQKDLNLRQMLQGRVFKTGLAGFIIPAGQEFPGLAITYRQYDKGSNRGKETTYVYPLSYGVAQTGGMKSMSGKGRPRRWAKCLFVDAIVGGKSLEAPDRLLREVLTGRGNVVFTEKDNRARWVGHINLPVVDGNPKKGEVKSVGTTQLRTKRLVSYRDPGVPFGTVFCAYYKEELDELVLDADGVALRTKKEKKPRADSYKKRWEHLHPTAEKAAEIATKKAPPVRLGFVDDDLGVSFSVRRVLGLPEEGKVHPKVIEKMVADFRPNPDSAGRDLIFKHMRYVYGRKGMGWSMDKVSRVTTNDRRQLLFEAAVAHVQDEAHKAEFLDESLPDPTERKKRRRSAKKKEGQAPPPPEVKTEGGDNNPPEGTEPATGDNPPPASEPPAEEPASESTEPAEAAADNGSEDGDAKS